MLNGDPGLCRLDGDLGCICDKEPAQNGPCGEILNPQCEPEDCKMLNGDPGQCRLDGDLGCICDKEPAQNGPCGEILNPKCEPEDCKMLNGDPGLCRLDGDLGCICDKEPAQNGPCGDILNPRCEPAECQLLDGSWGDCKRVDSTCSCEPRAATCTSNKNCLRSELCILEIGVCKGTGLCKVRPTTCSKLLAPVCGCDDQTYRNPCEAAKAGVNIVSLVACE